MTTIYINGRFLTQPVTGVQRFAGELTSRLAAVRDVVVLVPGGERLFDVPEGLDVRPVGTSGGHRWEQLALPAYLNDIGSPFLLGLTNTGPVRYRNQVATHHDITYLRFPKTYSWKFRTAYRLLSRMLLPNVRRIVTVSEFSKREIAGAYRIAPERIDVVPNAVSPALIGLAEPVADGERDGFLAVGSLMPHKNLKLVADAYDRFRRDTGSTTPLRVIGSVSAQLSGGVRLDDVEGIEILGRVDDARLAALYATSRALVFASAYEGFGIPPVEAQSLGAPVISSDAEALIETLGDSGYRFDRHSVDALTAALTLMDTDAALRADLAARGYENAARYSWDRSAELLDQTVTRALGEL